MPLTDNPIAVLMMPVSVNGVSISLSGPNSSYNPSVHLNTPPFLPTSSPITITLLSLLSSHLKADFTASTTFIIAILSDHIIFYLFLIIVYFSFKFANFYAQKCRKHFCKGLKPRYLWRHFWHTRKCLAFSVHRKPLVSLCPENPLLKEVPVKPHPLGCG